MGVRRVLALTLLATALAACARPAGGLLGRDLRGELPLGIGGADVERPAATLVRFWTDACPHCAATLPALEGLRMQLPDLRVLAIYHPKPAGPVEQAAILSLAAGLGFHGTVALDPGWERLTRWRPVAGRSAPTSYSLLLDRDGIVRWVHPGPRLHPSDEPAHADADRAYAELERRARDLTSP